MHSFINLLRNNKLFAVITILGFSVSLSFVLLLASFTYSQLTLDNFQTNSDNVFLVANEQNINSGYFLNRYLSERFPEIDRSCAYQFYGNHSYENNGSKYNAITALADTSFFDIFSFEVSMSQVSDWKIARDKALISHSFAYTVFGSEDPIGQILIMENGTPINICGVFSDFKNTIFNHPDIILRGELCQDLNPSNNERMTNATSSLTFIMIHNKSEIISKHDEILVFLKEICWAYNSTFQDVKIIPFDDIYFLKEGAFDWTGSVRFGDQSLVKLLLFMCIGLLVFAVFNYINMSVALFGLKAKALAISRLLGVTKVTIFIDSIKESTLLCFLSSILAIIFAEVLSPFASTLLASPFSVFGVVTTKSVLLFVLFVIIVGIIAGVTPSVFSSRITPISVVRGTFKAKMKTTYSKLIIFLQLTATSILIFIAIIMGEQVKAMISAPLHYNTQDILDVKSRYGSSMQLSHLFDRLRQEFFVENVGCGMGTPLSGTNNLTIQLENGSWISFQQIIGDNDYFTILGLLEKQDNQCPGAYWLNEYALKEIGLDDSAESFYSVGGEIEIGGIYFDFKISPLLKKQSPALIYNFRENEEFFPRNILIKTYGDHKDAFHRIEHIISEEYPGMAFDAEYLDEEIADSFSHESRLVRIVLIFTIIILLVSALGLFAVSHFNIKQQYLDVAIKSFLGEYKQTILKELIIPYIKISLISAIVAIPLGKVVINQWMSTFPYQISVHWWYIIVPICFAISITIISVIFQTLTAIKIHPTELINNE